jgi:hypothetical protein
VLYCNVEEESAATGNAFSAKVFEKAKAEGAKPSSFPPRSRPIWSAWTPKNAPNSCRNWACRNGPRPHHPRRL